MHRIVVALALSGSLTACLVTARPASRGDGQTGRHGAKEMAPERPVERPQAATGPDAAARAPSAATGWKTVDRATARRIDAFARDYAGFLGRAKTARAAVTELIREFVAAGGQVLPAAGEPQTSLKTGSKASLKTSAGLQPGARYYLAGRDGHTVAFVKIGRQPLEAGVRLIVAAVDAPHIQLKQRPIYDRAGLAMFDTVLHGSPDLKHWLSRPLALHVHMARPGSADGGLDLIVGERPDDPVLVIPDLLPHLSGKIQRKTLIDSPERMDAIAARSYRALVEYLAGQGVDVAALATAESALVPAGPPVFVGVDRALLSGHGHSHRALAYAAVRALAAVDADDSVPEQSAVVIVVRTTSTSGGTSGLGFVRVALSQLLGALAGPGREPDILALRRMYALSTALVSSYANNMTGERGVALTPRGADAVPRATRRIMDSLDRGGAPYQLVVERGWSAGRALGALDMDAVGVTVPTRHQRAPFELISTLDLHYALLAARAWLVGS